MNYSIAVTLALAAACTPKSPAMSSNSILTPERTWVIVAKPAQPAAIDVARLFQARGFMLSDLQRDESGTTLRFHGHRKDASEVIVTGLDVAITALEVVDDLSAKNSEELAQKRLLRGPPHQPSVHHYEIGSVFYVRIEPRGETMTSISVIGRPTSSGVEACTKDPELDAPCEKFEVGPSVHRDVAGLAEAEIIHSVFSELRLHGSVIAPDAATLATAEENRRCWAIRADRVAKAARVSNPRAKAGIMRTAPQCGTPEPAVASK